MSIIAPSIRRPWWPYATVAAALVLVGAVAYTSLSVRGGGDSSGAISVAAPGVEQAPWKVQISAAAGGKSVVNRYGEDVETTVEGLYEAAFLQAGDLRSSAKDFIAGPAADAFDKDKLGIPSDAEDVEITSRRAEIVIERNGRAAAAVVTLAVQGDSDGKDFSLRHKATLWVERDGSNWQVIGFDAVQEPAK